MRKKELFKTVLDYFQQTMSDTETELDYGTTFQLLVAVVLSAQCTDKRVNLITPKLFEDYPTAETMALATPEVIFEYIKSVSYPNNKAKHLVVDTHVYRVSHRLALVPPTCTTPYSVEMALKRYIPENKVAAAHYWLLLHGRYVCKARRPLCDKCGINHLCHSKDRLFTAPQ